VEINSPVRHLLKAFPKSLIACVLFFQIFMVPGAIADTSNTNNLSIATASNFRPVLEKLSEAFSNQKSVDIADHQINISSASSGVLYAQILQGAPFQLFFSANESFPKKLVAGGYGEPETLATYAIGKLVLVSRNKGDDFINENPVEILSKAQRIAIANPRTAPYGEAAIEVLENLGVIEESKPKLVMGNNIAQAWQFFHSGNADVTIVAASLIYSSGQSGLQQGWLEKQKLNDKMFLTIDLSSHLKHSVEQGRVAIKPMSSLAQEFLNFMDTSAAKKIIVDGGYVLPMTEVNVTDVNITEVNPAP
jgi:molybdate transport system substrate-binding protein